MSASIKKYLKVFDIDINQEIYKILLKPEIQQEIIDYNHEQLSQGVDSQEQKIITISAEEQGAGNVYAFKTISERAGAGLQTNNVDLNFSGQFWSTFAVKVTKDSFEIIANFNSPGEDIRRNFDSKYEFLGLIDDNLESFVWLVLYRELEKVLPQRLKENAQRYLN